MLSWPPTVRIFVCSDTTDMRKGFASLACLVESSLALDPLSGHLFVFRSRRGDRIKVPTHPMERLGELLPDVWFEAHPHARRNKVA
jgi:transposase